MSDPGPATVRLTDAAPGRGATGIELDQLPEQLAQNLVKTLRLGVRYNKSTNQVRCEPQRFVAGFRWRFLAV